MIVAFFAASAVAVSPPTIVAPTIEAHTRAPSHRLPPRPREALYRGMVKLTPQEAVMKAADAFPRPLAAVVEFTVRRAEQVGANFFLNSEADYRDPRNISVRISPQAIAGLRARFGPRLGGLTGRAVLVVGPVMRTRIDFTTGGKPSGKFYYQTHQIVFDANQVELAN